MPPTIDTRQCCILEVCCAPGTQSYYEAIVTELDAGLTTVSPESAAKFSKNELMAMAKHLGDNFKFSKRT